MKIEYLVRTNNGFAYLLSLGVVDFDKSSEQISILHGPVSVLLRLFQNFVFSSATPRSSTVAVIGLNTWSNSVFSVSLL